MLRGGAGGAGGAVQEQEEKHRERMLQERRAIEEKEAAARKKVEDGEALKALGNALLKAGDLPAALDKYQQAVATDPGQPSPAAAAAPCASHLAACPRRLALSSILPQLPPRPRAGPAFLCPPPSLPRMCLA